MTLIVQIILAIVILIVIVNALTSIVDGFRNRRNPKRDKGPGFFTLVTENDVKAFNAIGDFIGVCMIVFSVGAIIYSIFFQP